jgi:hypothetical protein
MVKATTKRQKLVVLAAVVLTGTSLVLPAASQQMQMETSGNPSIASTAAIARVRQVISQDQNGVPLVARSTSRTVRVVRGRPQLATDDPAVSGKLERAWKLRLPDGMPAEARVAEVGEEREDSGAFASLPEVHFAPIVEEQLSPGARRDVTLNVDGSSVLLGSAQWIGTNSPLNVTLSLNGAMLASGRASRGQDNRGKAVLKSKAAAPGLATLVVTNTSDSTVIVRVVLGALPQ